MVLSPPIPVSSNTIYSHFLRHHREVCSSPRLSPERQCLRISGGLKAGTSFLYKHRHWWQNGLKHGRVRTQWHVARIHGQCVRKSCIQSDSRRSEKKKKKWEKDEDKCGNNKNKKLIWANDYVCVCECVRPHVCADTAASKWAELMKQVGWHWGWRWQWVTWCPFSTQGRNEDSAWREIWGQRGALSVHAVTLHFLLEVITKPGQPYLICWATANPRIQWLSVKNISLERKTLNICSFERKDCISDTRYPWIKTKQKGAKCKNYRPDEFISIRNTYRGQRITRTNRKCC